MAVSREDRTESEPKQLASQIEEPTEDTKPDENGQTEVDFEADSRSNLERKGRTSPRTCKNMQGFKCVDDVSNMVLEEGRRSLRRSTKDRMTCCQQSSEDNLGQNRKNQKQAYQQE